MTVLAAFAYACVPVSGAAAGVIREYGPVDERSPTRSYLGAIESGPGKSLWFTDGTYKRISRITLRGRVRHFKRIPRAGSPLALTRGRNKDMWFAQQLGTSGGARLGRITARGSMSFVTPPSKTFHYLMAVTTGSDGRIWYTQYGADEAQEDVVGGFAPATRAFTEIRPGGNPVPTDLAAGRDGSIWVTLEAANAIARIGADGSVSQHRVPSVSSQPTGTGPDGPTYSSMPAAITPHPDGSFWFVERATDKIARIAADGSITEFPAANSEEIRDLVVGPDRRVWFTDAKRHRIGRMNAAGSIRYYRIPTRRSRPTGIAVGPDRNVWFTEQGTGKIGRVDVKRAR